MIRALRSQCQGSRPHKSHMWPEKKSTVHRASLENAADIDVLFTWRSSHLLGTADTPGCTCSPLPHPLFSAWLRSHVCVSPLIDSQSPPSLPPWRSHSARLHLIPASFCCVLGLMSSRSLLDFAVHSFIHSCMPGTHITWACE